jgi:hypothetical protein
VNQTLSHLEAAVRLLLPPDVSVALTLDPKAARSTSRPASSTS